MTCLKIAYLIALALCLADIGDRWLWHRKLRRLGINSRMSPMPLDWLLALVPPAYAVRRWRLWR